VILARDLSVCAISKSRCAICKYAHTYLWRIRTKSMVKIRVRDRIRFRYEI